MNIYNDIDNLLNAKGYVDTTGISESINELKYMIATDNINYAKVKYIYNKYKNEIDCISKEFRRKNMVGTINKNINTNDKNEQVINIEILINDLYRILIIKMIKGKVEDSIVNEVLTCRTERLLEIVKGLN